MLIRVLTIINNQDNNNNKELITIIIQQFEMGNNISLNNNNLYMASLLIIKINNMYMGHLWEWVKVCQYNFQELRMELDFQLKLNVNFVEEIQKQGLNIRQEEMFGVVVVYYFLLFQYWHFFLVV